MNVAAGQSPSPVPDALPKHVAIIMDGNGRWAQQRGLPRIDGHRAGAETVRRVIEAAVELGLPYLTLYAFSTENWQRPKTEVRQLMGLLRSFLLDRLEELHRHDVRLKAIGQLDRLPRPVRMVLDRVIAATRSHGHTTLTLALSYGARAEITDAVRRIAEQVRRGELSPDAIGEQDIARHLYTCDMPDPDLVIRTSGEFRLSNFMLWQASYAELWVTSTLWPDFGKDDFRQAIAEFGRRRRRFGGLGGA